MLLSSVYQNIIDVYLNSPLDQFGSDDEDVLSILDYSILDSIPGIRFIDEVFDWSAITELDSISDWVALALGNVGLFIFDDEDSDSSEWEESDVTTSSLQAAIFTANVIGMVPGVETTTSDASLTFMLSIATIVTITLLGFSLHSIRYVTLLYPTGTPTVMAPFIILIEFVSYIARAVSLGMRLFANMFAGHSLVKILMSFAWLFLNSALPVLSIPVFVLLLGIFMMEVGIAYLQSYVFSALVAMYMEDAISLGH
jgi:ATP synthase subunit 6